MFTSGGQVDLSFACIVRGGGGKGGGGGYQPTVPQAFVDPATGATYMDPTELNKAIADRKKQELADTETKKQADAQAAAAKETAFQTSRTSAYDNALAAVQRTFQQQGIDATPYMASDIVPALQKQYASIQDLDPNPGAAFPSSLADTIIGNLTSGKRSQATNKLNTLFTPNYSSSLIPDTADDPYIDQILSEQFNPVSDQLTNALKRGTLNEVGYKGATDVLGQKRTAARDTVSSLGSNILATDRKGIDDLISGARSSASSLGLNDAFDPSVYTGQASSKAAGYLGNLGGALRNAVGGTKFADLSELINAGGSVQGPINPTPAAPFVDPNDTLNKQRGLGNTGSF